MHPSAMRTGKLFFDTYGSQLTHATVVDIGAQDVTGSLRSVCPTRFNYVGADLAAGKGVDVILNDPYRLPFADQSLDIVVCSSVFEHTEMFWLMFLEIIRTLTPRGLFYLNAPSNGAFHRYPVDSWRFYPDAGNALVNWAKRNGFNPVVLESFIGKQDEHMWSDFVSVFLKDSHHIGNYPARIIQSMVGFSNATVYGKDGFINLKNPPEDMEKLIASSS